MRKVLAGSVAGAIAAWFARKPSLMAWPTPVRRAFPPMIGASVGLAGIGLTEVAARGVGILRGRRPIHALRAPLLVGAGAAAGVWLVRTQHKRALGSMFRASRSLDPACQAPPTSPLISGSPESDVPWTSVGREGGRFLSSSTTAADVAEVMGAEQVKEPIRIYVGYDSAPTVEERVALALTELQRTKAFERSVLLIQATAGTGFANPTPVDVVEILTKGDCATVSVSYGLLPSFLSLDRIERGLQTQRMLIDAIARERPRARVLLYGESLGATVQQGALTPSDLTRLGIDRVLWVGTPGGAERRWPEAIVVDNPSDIPRDRDAPVWLLEHHADPVVRLSGDLSWRKPEWLRDSRGRGVPPEMVWVPFITHAQVFVDVLFATDVRPGDFQSHGHDYRADLAAVVVAAYGFPGDSALIERLDERLRALEIARAARFEQGILESP